jgi:hypothetical protein
MKKLRFFLILFWLGILPSAFPQNRVLVEGRLINRTNPSIIASGIELELIELSSGMSIIKTATTDAAGKFRIEGLPESQQLMIRATYQGANYHSPLSFDSAGKASLEMEIFEATSSMKDIRVAGSQMAFQLVGDQLQAVETLIFNNATKPPRVFVHPEGTFRISKAPGILEPPKIRVTAPGTTLPLVQAALESADGQSYFSLYPLRPGMTTFEVQQTFPYADRQFTYVKKFYQNIEPINVGVIPQDLALSGKDLTKIQINSAENFAVYRSAPILAGSEIRWTFSGGTPTAAAAPAAAPAAEPAAEESPVTAMPVEVERNALIIGPLLLLGFVLVLWYAFNHSRGGSQKAADAHIRQLKEHRDALLTSVAEIDHHLETDAIGNQEYLDQREEAMRQLRKVSVLLQKM